MINPNPSKIEDILNSSIQFQVPKYQREYTWGKNEALEFWDDLKSYADSGEGNLFLGTIIFDISEKGERVIRIVDGQQRITTILLLLIALRTVAKRINATNLSTLIQTKITFTDPTTARTLGCKLVASESIKDVFEEISNPEWNGSFPVRIGNRQVKRQVNRIKPIYDFFLSETKDFDQNRLSDFLRAIYDSYIVRIDIEDETEAFSIFERTNARGIDLEASDLLKNYLFARGVDGLEEAWSQIIDNSDGTVLRMLKYFYVAKKGYVAKSDLYKKIRDYGNVVGASKLVDELCEFSRFYNFIRVADSAGVKEYLDSIGCSVIATDTDKFEKIHVALEGLRLFKIFQIYPLIYAAMSCFVRSGGGASLADSKKLIHFFETLERYHFVNNAICERIGNEVEKLYANFCVEYSQSDDFGDVTKKLTEALRAQLASEEEFRSRFVELSYSSESIPLISYVFDRFNNFALRPGHRIKIFNPDQKVLRKNHNIEHFYPQNPDGLLDDDFRIVDAVDNIGNLLAISFSTNSKLGNLLPAAKVEKLNTELQREIQNLPYVREFIEAYGARADTWNDELIGDRARSMAEIAYSKIWKIG